jgi:hypothetical protein
MHGIRIFNTRGKIRYSVPSFSEDSVLGNETIEVTNVNSTVNTITLAYEPLINTERVYLNGALLSKTINTTEDYSITSKTITFSYNLVATDKVQIIYKHI